MLSSSAFSSMVPPTLCLDRERGAPWEEKVLTELFDVGGSEFSGVSYDDKDGLIFRWFPCDSVAPWVCWRAC